MPNDTLKGTRSGRGLLDVSPRCRLYVTTAKGDNMFSWTEYFKQRLDRWLWQSLSYHLQTRFISTPLFIAALCSQQDYTVVFVRSQRRCSRLWRHSDVARHLFDLICKQQRHLKWTHQSVCTVCNHAVFHSLLTTGAESSMVAGLVTTFLEPQHSSAYINGVFFLDLRSSEVLRSVEW